MGVIEIGRRECALVAEEDGGEGSQSRAEQGKVLDHRHDGGPDLIASEGRFGCLEKPLFHRAQSLPEAQQKGTGDEEEDDKGPSPAPAKVEGAEDKEKQGGRQAYDPGPGNGEDDCHDHDEKSQEGQADQGRSLAVRQSDDSPSEGNSGRGWGGENEQEGQRQGDDDLQVTGIMVRVDKGARSPSRSQDRLVREMAIEAIEGLEGADQQKSS